MFQWKCSGLEIYQHNMRTSEWVLVFSVGGKKFKSGELKVSARKVFLVGLRDMVDFRRNR